MKKSLSLAAVSALALSLSACVTMPKPPANTATNIVDFTSDLQRSRQVAILGVNNPAGSINLSTGDIIAAESIVYRSQDPMTKQTFNAPADIANDYRNYCLATGGDPNRAAMRLGAASNAELRSSYQVLCADPATDNVLWFSDLRYDSSVATAASGVRTDTQREGGARGATSIWVYAPKGGSQHVRPFFAAIGTQLRTPFAGELVIAATAGAECRRVRVPGHLVKDGKTTAITCGILTAEEKAAVID